jgi:hypothetical protein
MGAITMYGRLIVVEERGGREKRRGQIVTS